MTATLHPSTTTPTRSLRWRVVDIVVASRHRRRLRVVFVGWDFGIEFLRRRSRPLLPGLQGLLGYGLWLFAGVLGGAHRPQAGRGAVHRARRRARLGAASATSGVCDARAGSCRASAPRSSSLAFLYAIWRCRSPLLAGAAAGLAAASTTDLWYPGADAPFAIVYIVCDDVSRRRHRGLLGSWLLVRALARTGALNRFAAGPRSAGRV